MTAGLRWSEEDMKNFNARKLKPAPKGMDRQEVLLAELMREKLPKPPVPGRMNKLEASYAQHLDALKHMGGVIWYAFEGIKLRLADATYYTPDFAVMTPDGIEIHETKGFWRDDARVKIKVAAEMFPCFAFQAITKEKGGGWKREFFGCRP